ncbi:PAAR domain-containing protein [Snodgrassella communis]|uniref:PAAR domain-containing protein n=1 Tax=Snodgrassella communis TaxID=2946699 RepID=UPI0011869FAC|nr:PAAR domain-containing protein [Snodgrassella communis]
MAKGYFLRVGDRTTCGGKIISGDSMILWHGIAATWEGDWVICGQHSGTYRITGGVSSMFSLTKKLAGSISSISTCPCDARFIPTITDSYTDDTLSKPIKSMPYSRSFYIQSPENIKTYGVAYAIKPLHAYWKVNQAGMAIWNRYKPRNLSR